MNNKLIKIIKDFENEKEKKEQEKIKPSSFSILSLALLTAIFGVTAITQAEKNRTLEQENALLKTTLQQQTGHAPTSPASLEVPPLPPSYSEFIQFNGWTVCEDDCKQGAI